MQVNLPSLSIPSRPISGACPLFFSVPRLWKKFQGGILEKLPQHKLDKLLRIPLVKGLIARSCVKHLGLARARLVISGAAPIAPSLLGAHADLGIEILEGTA